MTTPLWESGHLYLPGDLVQPITAAAAIPTTITNPDFESGATGWTLPGGAAVVATGGYSTPKQLEFSGTAGNLRLVNTPVAVTPGTTITASAMYAQGAASAGENPGRTVLVWYTAGMVELTADESLGAIISEASNGGWRQSVVSGLATGTAAFVAVGFRTTRTDSATSYVDHFVWDLAVAPTPAGLIYKAVQATAGTSGSAEPAWPSTLGVQVVDNEVTWEAVNTSRVTWQASPILLSGTVEPVWPTEPGTMIVDGTVAWECITRRVEDENCPNSKVVTIAAGKVFAGDADIVRFSATANPLDWTSPDDAGFLPTGLQANNANDVAVLNIYRSNVTPFNASTFQMWQVDPDPTAMAIMDQMEGIGSTWQQAAQPVGDELFFLSQLGVRTVGIAAGSTNLQAGDVGMPVDELVRDAMRVAIANDSRVLSTYYPGAGQYWLTVADYPPPALALSGSLPDGMVGDTGTYQYSGSGGVMPYAMAVTAGALPAGASLGASGLVTYTYTTAGAYSWTVQATDADASTATVVDTASILLRASMMAFSPVGSDTLRRSPNGTDWSSAGFNPGGSSSTAAVYLARSGLEILRTTTDNLNRFSADAGVTWTACTGLSVSGGGGRAVKLGGYWHVQDTTNKIHRSANGVAFSVVATAPSANAIVASGDRLVAVYEVGNGWVYRSDDAAASSWTRIADLPTAFLPTGSAMAQGGATLGLATCNSGAYGGTGAPDYRAHILKSTTAGTSWTEVANPFPDKIDPASASALQIHYDATLALWVVAFFDRVAYGATLDTLTLSAHVFPQMVYGLDSDGTKFIVSGPAGMLETSANGNAWTALTSGVATTIWDVCFAPIGAMPP